MDDAVLAAVERERQRIGDQLHKKLCQSLAGVSILAGLLNRRAQRGEPVGASEIEELTHNIQLTIDETRALSQELRGSTIQEGGLIEALALVADEAAREVPCEFVCEKPVFVRDARVSLALLRIAEESVRDAIQHRDPKKIVISLTRDGKAVTVKIQDNGTGSTPPSNDEMLNGIGLMRRRARAAGASLIITSHPDTGTVVSCTVPNVE